MAISKEDRMRLQRYALRNPLAEHFGAVTDGNRYKRRDHWIIVTVEKTLGLFGGVAVWHAQLMRINPATGNVLPWGMYATATKTTSIHDTQVALDMAGINGRDFVCRDNTILHRYRPVNGEEWETFGAEFHAADPLPIVGGPVEILYEDKRFASVMWHPCENPNRHRPEWQADPLAWLPLDCGVCEPCQARASAESPMQRQNRILAERAAQRGVIADDVGIDDAVNEE